MSLRSIPSPTIAVMSGNAPAANAFARRSGFAFPQLARPSSTTESSSLSLRTGSSLPVALHLALLRRSYGSIPHDSSSQRCGLSPHRLIAISGALGHNLLVCPNIVSGRRCSCKNSGDLRRADILIIRIVGRTPTYRQSFPSRQRSGQTGRLCPTICWLGASAPSA